MADRWKIRARIQAAKERLRDYEGSLKELEGRLKDLQRHAGKANGAAKVRLRKAERDVRAAMDTTLTRLDATMKTLEPKVRQALKQTKVIARSVRVGVRAGAEAYRKSRKS